MIALSPKSQILRTLELFRNRGNLRKTSHIIRSCLKHSGPVSIKLSHRLLKNSLPVYRHPPPPPPPPQKKIGGQYSIRACLHGGGGPQVSELARLGGVKNYPPLHAILQPLHPGCTFSRLLNDR